MSVYKLAGSGSGGTEDAIAQLDVQFDGVISALYGSVRATLDANTEFAQYEVSFISTNTIGSNDTRGSLFIHKTQLSLTTSGAAAPNSNSGIGGLAIAINAGERLWLHCLSSASTSSSGDFFIYVEDGQSVPLANRRR